MANFPGRDTPESHIHVIREDVHFEDMVHKSDDWTGAVTAQATWTPASGKRFVMTDLFISCSSACTVTLFDGTDTEANRVLKADFAQYGGVAHAFRKPWISAAVGNVLKLTTSAAGGYISVAGYEIEHI